ncbi:hypothetical protein A2U01_0102476, partial [Trifolium medium]|nr:hypothetical protein [Trifolium medium]
MVKVLEVAHGAASTACGAIKRKKMVKVLEAAPGAA